ncbi:MAG: RNA polymerase subunit sigma [Ideonella sp. MAG2]|nr:MAG: RNA polymerase subunit sigma [Ideonella sp. MAG2]
MLPQATEEGCVGDSLKAAMERCQLDGGSVDALYTSCYPELKRIAHSRLYSANLRGHYATESLLHESYLKLAQAMPEGFADRGHFLAYASTIMRHLIVDEVRHNQAQRRGGGQMEVTLNTGLQDLGSAARDVGAVDQALKDLAAIEPTLARLVEMRFFGGLTELEVADALGVSERTVRREWGKARAALLVLLEGEL